ncbi:MULTISPECIES: imidazole glycerol phosphate synthase subunit HisH [unclassified Roseofilum]|uniref:imidazole glycerol phosphate synthase subunit HisH n=1 Tax=unclassified Roseofilum TaxID=2620099 RepID=UPI000E9FD0AE|nr:MULTISPECIES: imidazole glycerol phosphate synthase subunit HisH [unclassified Roseofilum]HBR00490.1 imidazole glycerol phosphate synthase subunit HisH [Cyanobacteria bacterium UBA11691]MBP0007396.1 imidazole glycerol phosphate synthase subunit HisH [Roseofilum sp. Belize Diploria]MBP0015593.1 imidazole glycerol phosphate synthase subunit HisH [Roseofilum sp. SID3]MBP0022690.1 imidazole glycerol phosphate synthase subunit HisH [Roseofilum sp. SID2]MBP0033491.1 imidazole glycerol phosphate s
MSVIAVIDYDMGNLHSVCKGLEKAGATPKVTDRATEIHQADAVVLPGVGAFDPAVEHIRSRYLEDPIKEAISSGKPFLGICLGLQILFDYSEEGQQPGLGILPGAVRRFHWEPGITIPHMGWNHLHFTQPDIPLWTHLSTTSWMYFVHSYYVDPQDKAVCGATVTHGTQCVTAAIAKNNLMAVQFHPEKSDRAGLQILSNFVEHVRSQSPICV